MLKAIVAAMMAFMLIVSPIAFYTIQTAEGKGKGAHSIAVGGSECGSGEGSGCLPDGVHLFHIRICGSECGNGEDSGGGPEGGDGEDSGGGPEGGDGEDSGGGPEGGNNEGGDNANSGKGCSEGSNNAGAATYLLTMLALYDPSALVINEIHADLEKPTEYGNGEVELYNWGAEPIDISRWYLENKTGYVLATIENREIGPLEFLVVDVIGLTGDSQEVTLFDSEGYERDSAMYSGATSHIGSCYARISDGLGNWVWTTICTLGSSNRMGPY